MKKYTIRYRMDGPWNTSESIEVKAKNKVDAYWEAIQGIFDLKKYPPYSAWVESTETKTGEVKYFNTFEGKRY